MGKLCALFKLFSLTHFVYIFLSVGIAVGLIFAFRRFEGNARKYAGIGLVAVAVLFALLDFVGKVSVVNNVAEYLPLNLCHIFAYICIYLEITKSSSWTKFAYLIMLPLSVISLLFMPNEYTAYGEASLSVISFIFMNAMIIAYSLLRLIWNDEYLENKDILNSTLNYAIIIAIAHILNVFFRFTTLGVHANYMGTMGENYDMIFGLMDKIIPIPFVNYIPLFAIIVGIEFLLIIPFGVMKTRQDRRNQYEEIVALGNLKAQSKLRKPGKSQVLIRSDEKASPSTPKSTTSHAHKDGFVSINKEINVNKNKEK